MAATNPKAVVPPEVDSIEDLVDGRTMRRTRNRKAVISALLELFREGEFRPGAVAIADRAGVSHRSIFRYFVDLDDLVRTTVAQAFAEAGPLAEIPESGNGPRANRIERFVESRIALFDSIDGAVQVARISAPSIPAIDESIAVIIRALQVQIAHHFATELDALDERTRTFLIDGVLALTSYDTYSIHRRMLANDNTRMSETMQATLDALLPS